MEMIETLLALAGGGTALAVGATIHAVVGWVRSSDKRSTQRVVIEIDGERHVLTGASAEEIERSFHRELAATASRPQPPPAGDPA